jgi:hypothetical protein
LLGPYARHAGYLGARAEAGRHSRLENRIRRLLNPNPIQRWWSWVVLGVLMVFAGWLIRTGH